MGAGVGVGYSEGWGGCGAVVRMWDVARMW